jgi:hypothetical protein
MNDLLDVLDALRSLWLPSLVLSLSRRRRASSHRLGLTSASIRIARMARTTSSKDRHAAMALACRTGASRSHSVPTARPVVAVEFQAGRRPSAGARQVEVQQHVGRRRA